MVSMEDGKKGEQIVAHMSVWAYVTSFPKKNILLD